MEIFMKLLTLTLSILLYGVTSFACVPNTVVLNDAAQLTAEGLYDSIEKKITISLDAIESRLKKTGSAVINATDSAKQVTHKVIYLGSVKEDVTENGTTTTEIVQSSFLVKEIASGAERTLILKTNYLGNGIKSRSLGGPQEPKQDAEFKSLSRTVCQ
jgi:hypothetical protein